MVEGFGRYDSTVFYPISFCATRMDELQLTIGVGQAVIGTLLVERSRAALDVLLSG